MIQTPYTSFLRRERAAVLIEVTATRQQNSWHITHKNITITV